MNILVFLTAISGLTVAPLACFAEVPINDSAPNRPLDQPRNDVINIDTALISTISNESKSER